MSQACRSLISRILVPQRIRLSIDHIRNDAWLAASLVTVQTSTTDTLMDVPTIPHTKEMVSEKEKGMKKHVTDTGAQIVDIGSTNLNIPDENNNKYRYLR